MHICMHVAFAVPQASESPRCQTGSLEGAFGMWQCTSFPQKPRERVTGLHCFYMAPALSFPGPGFSITWRKGLQGDCLRDVADVDRLFLSPSGCLSRSPPRWYAREGHLHWRHAPIRRTKLFCRILTADAGSQRHSMVNLAPGTPMKATGRAT